MYGGKPRIVLLAVIVVAVLALQSVALAYSSWSEVVDEINSLLQKALNAYRQGDVETAKRLVNDAYFGAFEKEGMERVIRSSISARRASELEYKFTWIKKLMNNRASVQEVQDAIAGLGDMLRSDAAQLDGAGKNPLGVFFSSFTILVREGFEAILIIGAISAYLIRSGNAQKVSTVYWSAVLAIVASVLTAIGLQLVFRVSGAGQEILEGVTMLLATVVLFSVSYWMVSKAEAEKWRRFIEDKVRSSLSKGSSLALGAAAFLAVYREGAETVLFYQALLGGTDSSDMSMLGLGFVLGCVALAAIFLLVRYGSVRIPIKPFFLGTSVLLYYLAFVFAGQGMKELQEGGLLSTTSVPGIPAVEFLGIYPTWETILPQLILLGAAIAGLVYQFLGRSRR